ncbi:MAG: hypothetical protein AMJ65_09240 [Phycisphaerae bacterium SG8_4]|nr:MAG: hypothetical protein AMJ65_09240 [Phycisphaerae bacterium SG8_4]
MDLGVANRAGRVVEQDAERAGAKIQPAQTPPCAVEFLVRVLGVVAEVLVPVTSGAALARAEDDFLDANVRRPRLGAGC